MTHYVAGNGDQQIKLMVDITTNGFAWTRVFMLLPDGTKFPVPAGVSDATGDIRPLALGQASALQGKSVHVVTKIELFWEDLATRKIEFGKIGARYVFDNGADGHKEVTAPDQVINASGDFTTIYLLTTVKLD
ncbi:MAG: hypothetical protein J7623_25820 [Chitinophaga sp.]|uniref:hypothetical protein n=1 Tax=Chitinophaga sp. TaxID=1869181 RepID=UPI001B071549|nr:hypothetical protein [Chitinophaga sp.]MBO9732086.1 hypothetical protein [Chitinophaga sp.]